MKKVVIFLILLSFNISLVQGAEILFEDNFDAQPDYTSSYSLYLYGWNHRRSGEDVWSPTTGFPNHHDPFEVLSSNADKAKGNTGKSFVAWRESYTLGWHNWNSDGILSKQLDEGVDEICARFWIKFPSDVTNAGSGKYFRFSSYDGEGAFYKGFSDGNNAPIFLWNQTLENGYGLRNVIAIRADPQETNYYMKNPAPVDLPREINDGDMSVNYDNNIRDLDGDGIYENPVIPTFTNRQTGEIISGIVHVDGVYGTEWNQIDFCAKMNSAPGAMDGVARQWIRNQLTFENTQLPWQGTDSPGGRKWNVISFGGNDFFYFYPNEDKHEEWYAIDDVVIYKPLNSSSPLWAESPQDGRLPLDYVVGSATGTYTYVKPENLSITYQDSTTVEFSWDIPSNHNYTRFEILKNGQEIEALEGSNIYYIPVTQNWYRDTKLDPYTTYGFRVVGVDDEGNVYHSDVLTVEPFATVSLGEALDNTLVNWVTGGDAGWFGQTVRPGKDSESSAESGDIGNNQLSFVATEVEGPGTVRFFWKVSSELDHDILHFSVDGKEVGEGISGDVDWQQQSVNIEAGTHALKWTYSKNDSTSGGTDRAWLDEVVWLGKKDTEFPWILFLNKADNTALSEKE